MMLRIKPLLVLCAALLTVTPAASADVNSDMNQFFNKLGFASNTTQPGVWQGQAAGYAYGGSLYARTQVKNVQLISMTLPDINAGCGGIDAYLGSFSFINGEQLQRFVKQIMSNAAGYFFDLALQTTVPEIKTAKDFLQKMASDINSMNLSSCQAAQGIIGGLFPRTQVSQQKVCQDIAGESNIFADWAASRQGCTVGGKSDSVRDKASDKDKERVTKNINIMWNALSKNRMFDGNKELKEFVMTLAVFVLISLLVNVRTSVQIIDNSDLVKVHRVDNVPVGLAMPLSLTTRIGHAMVASYEMIFTQPDSVTYSKTGMLFGAELVSKSTDFLSRNPEIANLFQDYVQNCVMGDIYLNHKYTLEELMASADPYTLIFSRPSPLRGVYDSNNNFVTCKDASVSLKDKLNLDTQSGGKTWHYYAQQLFGGRPDPNLLFSTLIGDSYSYFYGSSKSASQIIRQNVTINALKEGITSYAARNGDSASLVNLATTSSMEKQRLAHVSIGHVAMRTLPMTQTILTGIAIGIFPLLVLAAVFNKLTLSVLKGYVFALMWLQSWPMLYAILNSAMTFYAKQNGAPVVLSEISQIQLKYSDLASTAGYLSMMIPPLSWMMVRGLGAGFSSVYSHFASSAISPTASAAGSVVDGNYSYGNMQTENVNGFSWSTNSTTSFGQMMYQTGSGATATQTRDGNMVMDASGAMSRLPVGINATRQIAAAQQEMAREASNRAESALHGFSSSIASAWNTLSQFGSNRGSSDSVTGGADSTMSAQDSMMASRMRSAVESYAKAHNISNEQATQELASTSTRLSGGMYADAHAEWGVKPKILGVGGGVGIRGGFKGSLDATDDDSHSASSGSRATHDARHDIDAKASKDFKEASDYFTSRKVSESGSHTDNNADSRVDQLSAALNSAKQSYDQYTTNMTRSHEYAEMASRTESMSGQMSEDLSQQFAQYVMKHAPQDAEAILTNTSSPEIAERRRAMAWSFVQEQVQPGVDNAWRESRGDIGKGMESVPSGGGSQDIIADHQGHQAIIDQRTQDSNIRNDVKHQVDNMVTEYKGNIGDTQNSIHGEENIVDRQYSELKNNHKQEEIQQNNRYNEENKRQKLMPTPSEDALKQMVDDKKERLKGPL
ncbi:TPA: conjugal transfer mating-pair stabilization protein TraG [Escherichia coli]